MIKQHYNKTVSWIEQKRFVLLLVSTFLVMVLPAFTGSGPLSEIIFVGTLSFLFIQSMIAAQIRKSRKRLIQSIVLILIFGAWLKPLGIDSIYIDIIKGTCFISFFVFVIRFLIVYISKSTSVNLNVLIASINIYLLMGIIGAFLALFCNTFYPAAYHFPENIREPIFANFLYFSFITMSTVGYGDITPCIPETQTLSYLISITGQLYVAIIIAFLVGKLLVTAQKE